MLHAVALCLLLGGMALIQKDVRRHLQNIVAGDALSEIAIIVPPVNDAGRRVFEMLHDFQDGNSLLAGFATVTLVFFLLMFRS